MRTRQPLPLYLTLAWLMVAAPRPTSEAAEAFRITESTQASIPVSKESDGMINDWLIRNDRVVAVIGDVAPGRDANQMVEGVQGAVLDFTYLHQPNDGLVVFYTMGYRPTGVSADRAEIARSGGQIAELVMVREATAEEPYTSTTRFLLRDGEDALRVTTIHKNTSSNPVEVPGYDWLRLDNDVEPQQPDEEGPVVLLDNRWFDSAYGLASTDGRARQSVFTTKGFRSRGVRVFYPSVNAEGAETIRVNPGEQVTLDRWLLLGRDAASVQAQADQLLDQEPRIVVFTLTDINGEPVEGAYVEAKQETATESAAKSDSGGRAALRLRDGTFILNVSQIGRPKFERTIVIKDGQPVDTPNLHLGLQSKIALDIADSNTGQRIPVKVELRPLDGAETPFLGPRKRANGSGNLFFSRDGQEVFPVPPGRYIAHVSRGPEYEIVKQEITVTPGGTESLNIRLSRAYETPGWLIADLHNHSTGSGDSATSLEGRVLNLAGSGIEFGLATEHNRISSYTGTIRELELQNFVASAAGIELSGRPGPGQINHQTAFPLIIRQNQQGWGAPRTHADPAVQMQRLYDLDDRSPKLMQHNHPDIAWLYFDKDRDGVADGGFGTRDITDVMEIRDAIQQLLKDTEAGASDKKSRAFHWLQMLNQGDRIFGTANSDAHAVGHDNGALFNFIKVPDDQPLSLYPWDVALAVKAGKVVMSNGPFLGVTIEGAGPGEEIAAPSGEIEVRVKVKLPQWSQIDRVQLLVNGRQLPSANFTREGHASLFGDAPLQFEHTFPMQLDGDAHVIVVAAGERSTMGELRSGRLGALSPVAVSNPIFIDVDGGGFRANGDSLGIPLPTALPETEHNANEED